MMTVGAPIHPGEHLAEILGELNISQYRLAKDESACIQGASTR